MASEETAKSNTALIVGSIVTILVALITSPVWGLPACRGVHLCAKPTPTQTTLRASPATWTFGSVEIGHASATRDVTIANPGPNPASVTVSVTGTDAADFNIVTQTCDSGLLSRETQCSVTLNFEPKGEGERSAALTLQASGADVSPSQVNLSGTGAPAGAISFTPATVFFDLMWLGAAQTATSQSKPLRVTNTGSGTVKIEKISIDDTAHFSVSFDNCDGRTLLPNDGCDVTLTFTQNGIGPLSATMMVTDDAPDSRQSLTLRGNRGPLLIVKCLSCLIHPTPTTTVTG